LAWPSNLKETDQVRITLRLRTATRVRHLALYPRAAT
jgi:hypothetical protein